MYTPVEYYIIWTTAKEKKGENYEDIFSDIIVSISSKILTFFFLLVSLREKKKEASFLKSRDKLGGGVECP